MARMHAMHAVRVHAWCHGSLQCSAPQRPKNADLASRTQGQLCAAQHYLTLGELQQLRNLTMKCRHFTETSAARTWLVAVKLPPGTRLPLPAWHAHRRLRAHQGCQHRLGSNLFHTYDGGAGPERLSSFAFLASRVDCGRPRLLLRAGAVSGVRR
eukprot:SAG22_NODE_848_length_6859_cov_5.488905_4_plen_155_part_00